LIRLRLRELRLRGLRLRGLMLSRLLPLLIDGGAAGWRVAARRDESLAETVD
jgi:hypothetical protein